MSPFVLLSALLHFYVGWRIVPALVPAAGIAFSVLLIASALLMPMTLLARRVQRQPLADRLAWAGSLAMGLFSSLFVLTLLRDVVLLVLTLAALVMPLAWLPGFERDSALAVPLLGLLATAIGYWNARRTAAVVEVDVPIAGLPAALHGFTIAQISDIHVGPTIKGQYLRRIVAAVNRLRADMVAVTGDLVDGSVPELASHVAPLAELASRHGTYFVTGNHEYYSGADGWVVELRRIGLNVLMNEHVVVRHEGAEMVVAGVTDYSAHHFDPAQRSDPQAAIAGAPSGVGARVLLAHQPRSADAAERAGFDLQLSGHTHGGQFWPWNLFVPLQQPFTAGLNRLRRLWVYTSRGTGYWGPPKRFGAPSEITRLRLVAG
ncbi:MAG TPA: metallophosphoesterase [Burkholderiaceae bacterium]|nr:metallophosphoesterase [Burkholderiaceae bacterium]